MFTIRVKLYNINLYVRIYTTGKFFKSGAGLMFFHIFNSWNCQYSQKDLRKQPYLHYVLFSFVLSSNTFFPSVVPYAHREFEGGRTQGKRPSFAE